MNEFTLYAYSFRSRAERVLWALKEFGFPYQVIRLDPFKGETRTKDFLKLNPASKIPVLCHGDAVYTESLAIIEYLNGLSENITLIPSEPNDAFNYRKKVHYALTEVESYLWLAEQDSHLKAIYQWPKGTYEEAMSLVKKNIKPIWAWLESSEYMVNNQFTLADIYFYHLITWANQHSIEHTPSVSQYLSRLQNRPAFPPEMLPR